MLLLAIHNNSISFRLDSDGGMFLFFRISGNYSSCAYTPSFAISQLLHRADGENGKKVSRYGNASHKRVSPKGEEWVLSLWAGAWGMKYFVWVWQWLWVCSSWGSGRRRARDTGRRLKEWGLCAQQAALVSFPMPRGTSEGFCIPLWGDYDCSCVLEPSPWHSGRRGWRGAYLEKAVIQKRVH